MNSCRMLPPAKQRKIIGLESKNDTYSIDYIDLFCGIGGFRLAIEEAARELGFTVKCVFSSDIDKCCQEAYSANFGEMPKGDITKISASSIPNHNILLAGFPCQPFSIIGSLKGFEDTRGTLFFDIARILDAKKPDAFVLENVKLLAGHNKGKTLSRILGALKDLGYSSDFKILNALDFGLPQKRERAFIVGFRKPCSFCWPAEKIPMKPLSAVLEKSVPSSYYASDYIKKNRYRILKPTSEITIWHENKAGHISAYPYSCALRAGASYNYLLVNGERRLTEREMLRLQGFPDSYKIVCNYSQTRKQAGNSLPVPVAKEILKNALIACSWTRANSTGYQKSSFDNQYILTNKRQNYERKAKTEDGRKIQSALPPE